jgi:transcriptional regulator with XRE-family HTH domain
MATRERPIDRGRRLARQDRSAIGAEIRRARARSGRSLAVIGPLCGMSASQAGRIERGVLTTATVDQLARLGATVGLDVRVRAYPGPDPALDAAQLRLLARFRARLDPSLVLRIEVPLPQLGDQRAFDAMLGPFPNGGQVAVEALARLADVQAEHRRIHLKLRDADIETLILLVADTRHNRGVLGTADAALRSDYPVPARDALRALAEGRHPGGSSIIRL